jgi:hypothetical protein
MEYFGAVVAPRLIAQTHYSLRRMLKWLFRIRRAAARYPVMAPRISDAGRKEAKRLFDLVRDQLYLL